MRHACPIYRFYLIIIIILVYVKITNYEHLEQIISRDCASRLVVLPFSYTHKCVFVRVYVCVTYFPIQKSINIDLPWKYSKKLISWNSQSSFIATNFCQPSKDFLYEFAGYCHLALKSAIACYVRSQPAD